MQANWLKQTEDKPLFPEILWSRPENRRVAGKLLVVGGHSHSFKAPADAFGYAHKAGAGYVRTVLPSALQRTVGKIFPEAQFATSTPSGSFGQAALAEWLDAAHWADASLLAGDFGKNSETAIVVESFLQKHSGSVALVGDSLDYFEKNWATIFQRQQTLLALDFGQLQKLAASQGTALKHSAELAQIVDGLCQLTAEGGAHILTLHEHNAIVATKGRVSTAPSSMDLVELASRASVFWLQNVDKPFEAISSSIIESKD